MRSLWTKVGNSKNNNKGCFEIACSRFNPLICIHFMLILAFALLLTVCYAFRSWEKQIWLFMGEIYNDMANTDHLRFVCVCVCVSQTEGLSFCAQVYEDCGNDNTSDIRVVNKSSDGDNDDKSNLQVVDMSKSILDIPEWFHGSQLNFAENLLRYNDDRTAIYATGTCHWWWWWKWWW